MQKITTLPDFLCTCQNQLPISLLCRVILISQIHVLTRSVVTRRNVLYFSIQWLLLNSVSLYRIQSIIRSGQKVSYHNVHKIYIKHKSSFGSFSVMLCYTIKKDVQLHDRERARTGQLIKHNSPCESTTCIKLKGLT